MSENIQSISQGTFAIGQTSATNFIAGPGIKIDEPSAGTVRIGNDEKVLWEGTGTTAFTASEPLTNFERIKFYLNSDANAEISCVEVPMIGRNTSAIKLSWTDTWKNDGQWKFLIWHGVLNNTGMSAFNNSSTFYLGVKNNFNAAGGNYGNAAPLFYKVVGINRISGNA